MKTILEQVYDNDFEVVEEAKAAMYAELGYDDPRPSFTKHNGETIVYPNFVNGDGSADRYLYDFNLCPAKEGWQQWDTDQDAHYFGVWWNPVARVTCTYAEGDESIVVCNTEAAWKAELQDMCDFYGDPPPAFKAFGQDEDGTWTETHYYDSEARP